MSPSFSPSQIAGLSLWLKADAITGLVDNDPVSTWNDVSGNAKNATGAGAARPTYKTGILNGKPVVRFPTSQRLDVPSLTSQTVFVVVNHTDGATFTDYRRVVDAGDNLGWSIFGDSGGGGYNPGTAAERGITTANFRINGALSVIATPLINFKILSGIATAPYTGVHIIGTISINIQYLVGDIAEILLYSSALTTTQRRQIEAYLGNKYAIAVT